MTRHIGFWKNFNGAFTLAEVLITLGIIGVVAAITMPTLIQNYKKQVYVNQLKKSVSMLEQGFQKMLADDEVDRLTYTSIWLQLEGSDIYCNPMEKDIEPCKSIFEDLKKYFSYLEISQAASTDDGYVQKFLNENDGDHIGRDSFIKFPDGMWLFLAFALEDYVSDEYVAYLTIDINGIKGPNMYGRDIFVFALSNNGKLKDFSPKEHCITSGTNGCYNRLVENGWKMDY